MIAADTPTVFAAFEDSARRWPDRPFLQVLPETAQVYGIEAGEIAYAAALQEVEALAARLEAAGYGAGHRVMVLLGNRPAFFLWFLALNRIGASIVPLNPDLRTAEQAYMMGNAEPVLVVSVPDRVEDLRGAAREAGVELAVIAPGDPLPAPREGGRIALRDGPPQEAEAALLYTSGTTGQPKGCVLNNTYYLQCGRWYEEAGGLCALGHEGERMLTPLPVFHMNAMAASFMAMVAVGGCLIVLDRFHPRSWWASVRESRATCLHYLGVIPSILMQAEPSPADRDHQVRFGFGAGVDPKLHAPFEERFGFPLVEGWAMTETGCAAGLTNNREPRRVGESCLGRPEPYMELRIVDDAGTDAATGQPGELLVRRAGADPRFGFFTEYFRNPQATAEVWEGGWFHTGDVVRQEADGSVFFVDRKKNVIRRSGENIAAVEVESALMRHPAIRAAGVAAVPDELRGDEVLAMLVVEGQGDASLAREITEWCLTRLAYYKAPGYIAFVDALPLTATQKIQRGVLKTQAAELLADPATHDLRPLKKRTAA